MIPARRIPRLLASALVPATLVTVPLSVTAPVAASPWTRITSPPPATPATAVVYDSNRHRLLAVGQGQVGAEVWALSLDDDPHWTQLPPGGSAAGPQGAFSLIFDPPRDRLLVFGGNRMNSSDANNDLWQLSLTDTPTWTQLSLAGGPAPRLEHTGIYDPVRERMIVFGGVDRFSCFDGAIEYADVHALSLTEPMAWAALSAPSGPEARHEHTAVYDPLGDRMIVYSGYSGGFCWGPNGIIYWDLWALSLGQTPEWTRLPEGRVPSGRWGHSAIFDAAVGRMLIFGGTTINWGHGLLDDTWEYSPVLLWRKLADSSVSPAPTRRMNHSAAYDPLARRMIVTAGGGPEMTTYETWSFDARVRVGVGPRPSPPMALRGTFPNPIAGAARVSFSLPEASPARLEILDIAGRRVAAREVGHLGPGPHVVDLAETGTLASGIYVVRLTQRGQAVTARAVVL